MSNPDVSRKKVIVICMLDSSHSARWLSQFKNQQVDFTLIPSTPNRKVHPTIRDLFSNSNNSATYSLSRSLRLLTIPIWSLDVILGNRLRGFIVSYISKKHKSDYIHALELNHAGYIASKASGFGLATNTRIISTNWGSDIYWFQKYERHQKQIIELMKVSHFYSAECHRDLALATKYGFEGKFLEVSPNAGGIPTEFLSRDLVPPSGRSVILVKGYETFVGRASIALDAISEISNELKDYEVILYSANQKTIRSVRRIRKETNLNIRAIPKKRLTHSEMLNLFGKARAYVGVSLSDGISTSLLEAMAMGAYPIQTNTSCAEEWIEDGITGKLIGPNQEEVKNSILHALNNDSLVDQASVVNRQKIEAKCNEEQIKLKSLKFYGL
jgi:glycosyltransferase involved in cell wall biosynthesis